MDPDKIGIGISTIAGVLGSIALVFLGVLQPLQDSLQPFGVDPNMFTWAGAARARVGFCEPGAFSASRASEEASRPGR